MSVVVLHTGDRRTDEETAEEWRRTWKLPARDAVTQRWVRQYSSVGLVDVVLGNRTAVEIYGVNLFVCWCM